MNDSFTTPPFTQPPNSTKEFGCEINQPLVGLISIPVLVVLVNSVMTVAVINYRSKLRQKNVYIYVSSTLVANVVCGLLTLYQMTVVPSGIEGQPLAPTASTSLRSWWTFRKAILPALYLIMIGNIGILIAAIRDGAQIIAKSKTRGKQTAMSSVRYQRNKALVLVAVVWIVPLVFAVAATLGWNCSNICQCTQGCFKIKSNHFSTSLRACSRLWTPMTNAYMSLLVIIWVLELIGLILLIVRTLTMTATRQRQRRNVLANTLAVQKPGADANTSFNIDENGDCTMQHSYKVPESKDEHSGSAGSEAGDRVNSDSSDTAWQKRLTIYAWSRSATKELCILVSVFVVCTLPTMVVLLLDIVSPTPVSTTVSFVLISLALVYCIICPFLLMRHLGGLRAAIEIMCVKATGTRVASKGSSHHGSTVRAKA